MRALHRRALLSACLIAVAIAPLVLYMARAPEPESHVDNVKARRTALIQRGVPEAKVLAYSEQQLGLTQKYVDEGLDPDVAALRAELEALDAPESSACRHARESERAETDKQFAHDVEKICVAFRKLMWDYAVAHSAEVETGDPAAIQRTRNAFAMMDVTLMRELMRAGGIDDETAPMPAAPVESAPVEKPTFEPELGQETKEEP